MIQGKQCTIVWYVDDLKISHVRRTVVDNVISTIEKKYGKMTVTRGKKHTYVGIDIEFIDNGKVSIHQKQNLEECIGDFGEVFTTRVTTPVQRCLFEISDLEC